MPKNNDNPLAAAVHRAAGAEPRGGARTAQDARVPPSRQGKKGVLLHVDPAVRKRLKLLAVEHDTSIEALGMQALDLLFKFYDRR